MAHFVYPHLPAVGLGNRDPRRPYVTGGLGKAVSVSIFLKHDLWIQISGAEPVLVGAVASPSFVSAREPVLEVRSMSSRRSLSGTSSRRTTRARRLNRLSGQEPGPPPTFPLGGRASGSANEPITAATGSEPGPVEGSEYDTDQSGRERGWPKSS
jgi:hypothetical protein